MPKRALNQTEIAGVLLLSERRVRTLSTEGVIPRRDDGMYDELDVLRAYVRHVQHDVEGRRQRAESARVEAMARRLKVEQSLGRMISTKELRELGTDLWAGVWQTWNLVASHLFHSLHDLEETERLRLVGELDQTAKAELHLLRERFAQRLKGVKVELEDQGRIEREMARLAGGEDEDDERRDGGNHSGKDDE